MCVQKFCGSIFELYGILIFGNAYPSHIDQLKIAQKKCIRIIAKEPPYAHCNPIFNSFNLLKLADIYKYNLGIYMYKNIDRFSGNLYQNPYSTRSGSYYIPLRQRLTLTSNQSVKVQALSNWNAIPDVVKNSLSVVSFKRKYKKHLLDSYNE